MSVIRYEGTEPAKVKTWKVRLGSWVSKAQMVAILELKPAAEAKVAAVVKVKATKAGKVVKFLASKGDTVTPGSDLMSLNEECSHPTLMKAMCADCGADLREELEEAAKAAFREQQNRASGFDQRRGEPAKKKAAPAEAAVAMVHSIPDLKVSNEVTRKKNPLIFLFTNVC